MRNRLHIFALEYSCCFEIVVSLQSTGIVHTYSQWHIEGLELPKNVWVCTSGSWSGRPGRIGLVILWAVVFILYNQILLKYCVIRYCLIIVYQTNAEPFAHICIEIFTLFWNPRLPAVHGNRLHIFAMTYWGFGIAQKRMSLYFGKLVWPAR